jgi:phosphohistidine phosphatase
MYQHMRRLILFRHAKAVPANALQDHDRPLAPDGVHAAPIMGQWLERQGFSPDMALVSSAKRTQETWALVRASFGDKVEVRAEAALYEAAVSTILDLVRETPDAVNTLLLIGHNPGLEGLAELLAGFAEAGARKRMAAGFSPGSVAVLNCTVSSWADLQPGGSELAFAVSPADLGAG